MNNFLTDSLPIPMPHVADGSAATPVVVSTVTNNYALALAVMLKSLELHLRGEEQVIVHVMFSQFDPALQRQLELGVNKEKISLHWRQVDAACVQGLKLSHWWPHDVYFRLLVEELFPQYDKVIFLDADVVVKRSVCELWRMEMGDAFLLAVQHATKVAGYAGGEYGVPAYKVLGIPAETKTFNAGVLVMNLAQWRKQGISKAIFRYLREYQEYVLWLDQDGLNAILHDKWRPVPYEWNIQVQDFGAALTGYDSFFTKRECLKFMTSPAIIHYAGGDKPWMPSYGGLFKEDFLQVVNCLSPALLEACSWYEAKAV
jgi:lipopolysaccharide biosynthesis glycosyltransferase